MRTALSLRPLKTQGSELCSHAVGRWWSCGQRKVSHIRVKVKTKLRNIHAKNVITIRLTFNRHAKNRDEILVIQERFTLVKQWKLPGGYVDPGEDIPEAAVRWCPHGKTIINNYFSSGWEKKHDTGLLGCNRPGGIKRKIQKSLRKNFSPVFSLYFSLSVFSVFSL